VSAAAPAGTAATPTASPLAVAKAAIAPRSRTFTVRRIAGSSSGQVPLARLGRSADEEGIGAV
jgi:hypothetical protein